MLSQQESWLRSKTTIDRQWNIACSSRQWLSSWMAFPSFRIRIHLEDERSERSTCAGHSAVPHAASSAWGREPTGARFQRRTDSYCQSLCSCPTVDRMAIFAYNGR
jgi:hypothetical protein